MLKQIVAASLLFATGCDKGDKPVINTFKADASFTQALEKAAQLNVFFGHQSVGYNIVDGILDIHAGKMKVIDLTDAGTPATPGPCFAHMKIGRNYHPGEKIADFAAKAASRSVTPDIAVMKFCFVDIDRQSDPEKLAAEYIAMAEAFQRDHPGVALLHMTVPLTPVGGIKGVVKGLVKTALGQEESNIRRMKYNAIIRNRFAPEKLFDFAALESTYADGRTRTAVHKGYSYQIMLEEYNLDNGHLNKPGRQFIAGEFIKKLAAVPLLNSEPAPGDSLK